MNNEKKFGGRIKLTIAIAIALVIAAACLIYFWPVSAADLIKSEDVKLSYLHAAFESGDSQLDTTNFDDLDSAQIDAINTLLGNYKFARIPGTLFYSGSYSAPGIRNILSIFAGDDTIVLIGNDRIIVNDRIYRFPNSAECIQELVRIAEGD